MINPDFCRLMKNEIIYWLKRDGLYRTNPETCVDVLADKEIDGRLVILVLINNHPLATVKVYHFEVGASEYVASKIEEAYNEKYANYNS